MASINNSYGASPWEVRKGMGVFLEDMRKIAPDKIGRALILLAIEDVTEKRA